MTTREPFNLVRRDLSRRAAQASADLIENHATWSYFITLTFRRTVDEGEAAQIARHWIERIARAVVREHFDVAVGIEPGELYGRIHVHLLLGMRSDTRRLGSREAREAWRNVSPNNGVMDFAPYQRGQGAVRYLLKADHWAIGVACPRDRTTCRHRCSHGPHVQ